MAQQMTNAAGPPIEEDMIGAIKIKDGLFIGDEFAAQDLEFVVANKVTHVINCAGKQITNHWEPIGVVYLTFYWMDQENQVLFDPKDETTNQIYEFIEDALHKAESVLIHSVRRQSRSSCVIAAYLMRKYKWSLLKTLEFLNSRRPDLEIRATFIHQLSAYETRLHKNGQGPKTSKWTEIAEDNCFLESEELLLRNTFLNAQMGPIAQFNPALLDMNSRYNGKLRWIDEHTNGRELLGQEGDPMQDLCLKTDIQPVTIHRKVHPKSVKAVIKVPVDHNNIMKTFPSQYYMGADGLKHNQQQNNSNNVQHAKQNSGGTVNSQSEQMYSNYQQQQDNQQNKNAQQLNNKLTAAPINQTPQQQLKPQSQPPLFHPQVDESVNSEDLSELHSEIISNNKNAKKGNFVPTMKPQTNITELDQKYGKDQQHINQQLNSLLNARNQPNQNQILIQEQAKTMAQQPFQPTVIVQSQQQQPTQGVTNIINNNNINNYNNFNAGNATFNVIATISINPVMQNGQIQQQQPQIQSKTQQYFEDKQPILSQHISPQQIVSPQPQIIQPVQSQPQQQLQPQQMQLQSVQLSSKITGAQQSQQISKQRSGSARPAQNIGGDPDSLNSNNQIVNTDTSEINQKQLSSGKKKRGESPKLIPGQNQHKYNVPQSQQNQVSLYQQVQNQMRNNNQPKMLPTQQNSFGSARMGGQGVQKGGNKLNSFRGGPVRAIQNVVDSTGDQLITNGPGQINKTVNVIETKKERPSSSKPIMKNSFNNDSSDAMKGPLSQILGQQRPGTAGNRPASPGTKLKSDSKQSNSSQKPKRLRSASPGQIQPQPQQPNHMASALYPGLNPGTQVSATSGKQQSVGTRILQATKITTSTGVSIPQGKHVAHQYMRGFSPSKPKWKV